MFCNVIKKTIIYLLYYHYYNEGRNIPVAIRQLYCKIKYGLFNFHNTNIMLQILNFQIIVFFQILSVLIILNILTFCSLTLKTSDYKMDKLHPEKLNTSEIYIYK